MSVNLDKEPQGKQWPLIPSGQIPPEDDARVQAARRALECVFQDIRKVSYRAGHFGVPFDLIPQKETWDWRDIAEIVGAIQEVLPDA